MKRIRHDRHIPGIVADSLKGGGGGLYPAGARGLGRGCGVRGELNLHFFFVRILMSSLIECKNHYLIGTLARSGGRG